MPVQPPSAARMYRTLYRADSGAHRASHRVGVRLPPRAVAFLLSLGSQQPHTGHMRAVSWCFAVMGGCALVGAVLAELVAGETAGAGWVLIGPAPVYVVGLAGAFRGPVSRGGTQPAAERAAGRQARGQAAGGGADRVPGPNRA